MGRQGRPKYLMLPEAMEKQHTMLTWLEKINLQHPAPGPILPFQHFWSFN